MCFHSSWYCSSLCCAERTSLALVYCQREGIHRAVTTGCGDKACRQGWASRSWHQKYFRVERKVVSSGWSTSCNISMSWGWLLWAKHSKNREEKYSHIALPELWKSLCRGLCVFFNRQPNAFCYYLQPGMSVPYAECVLTATKGRQVVAA